MGGRGSTSSAIISFGRKTGTRMLPKQYKEAVSDQADFILRDLKQVEPKQLIIKKSFKGGFAQITLDIGDGVNPSIENLQRLNIHLLRLYFHSMVLFSPFHFLYNLVNSL